jgi:hypothetical protein
MGDTKKSTKQRSREYPAITLNSAIAFVQKLENYILSGSVAYGLAAEALGVTKATKSFTYTLSAAKQFGLISTETGQIIKFLEPSSTFISLKDDTAIRRLKLQCFRKPKLYIALIDKFKGVSLPSTEALANLLEKQYDIAPAVTSVAADVFLKTANEAGANQNGILTMNLEQKDGQDNSNDNIKNTSPNTTDAVPIDSSANLKQSGDNYAKPLSIPFGDERQAILYMPIDTSQKEAKYVKDIILLMLQRVYGIDGDKNEG